MTGRFLTPAFVATVAGVLATVTWSGFGRWRRVLAAAILAGGLFNPAGPLRTGTDFGVVAPSPADFDRYGVTDERRVYYPDLGLYRAWLGAGSPERHGQASYAKARGLEKRPDDVVIWSSVGLAGYYAGPGVHIIDRNALADPLLARLPPEPKWRIGHFIRAVPAGYFESCKQRQNLIEDAQLRSLYADILLATRAPLFSAGRMGAIWRSR